VKGRSGPRAARNRSYPGAVAGSIEFQNEENSVTRSVGVRLPVVALAVLGALTGCGGGGGGGGGVVPTATPGASSTPTPSGAIINEYSVSGALGIEGPAVGSDGALWFADVQAEKFGRITTSGSITEYAGPTDALLGDIVPGANGTLWFADDVKIGVLSTVGSVLSEYQVPAPRSPDVLAFNPVDGRVWSVLEDSTLRSPALYALTQSGQASGPFPLQDAGVSVSDIKIDSVGNIWFTESNVGKIAEANTSGVIVHEYQITTASNAALDSIAFDSVGNVWYADGRRYVVGKLVPSTGAVTEYAIPQLPLEIISPAGITAAPDGNVWATLDGQLGDDGLARVTPSGIITEYAVSQGASPEVIVTGPDGNLWFSENGHVGELVLSSIP
jgi:virginiamycin B lyase